MSKHATTYTNSMFYVWTFAPLKLDIWTLDKPNPPLDKPKPAVYRV